MNNKMFFRNGDGINIDVNTCILCGICQVSCPFSVINVDKNSSSWTIHRDHCIMCGKCIEVCPKESLSFSNPHMAIDKENNIDTFNVEHKKSVREIRLEASRKAKLKKEKDILEKRE